MGEARKIYFVQYVTFLKVRMQKQHIRAELKQCDPFSGSTSVPLPLAY